MEGTEKAKSVVWPHSPTTLPLSNLSRSWRCGTPLRNRHYSFWRRCHIAWLLSTRSYLLETPPFFRYGYMCSMSVYRSMCLWMQTWRQQQNIRCLHLSFSDILPWSKSPRWIGSITSQLGWPASEVLGSSCLHLLILRLQAPTSMPDFLHEYCGFKLQSSHLQSKRSYRSIMQSQIYHFSHPLH